ncbi:hypothetical protein HK097_011153, partial [Rhizophlyctis rosea]
GGEKRRPDVTYSARPTPKTVRSLVGPLVRDGRWRLVEEVRKIVRERWVELEAVLDQAAGEGGRGESTEEGSEERRAVVGNQ